MIKRNLTVLSLFLLPVISVITSCGKQKQHDIEKIFDRMVKGGSPQEIAKAKSYTVDSLDFVRLDSLGLTRDYINTWTKLYVDKGTVKDLARDSKKLIDRLGKQSPKDIEVFVRTVANSSILAEYRYVGASIVAYSYGIDVPPNEYSEIAARLLVSTKLPGTKAPPVEGLQPLEGRNFTIILFYDGSCDICRHLLDELADNYDKLTAKGVRIVTVSADGSKEIFEEKIEKYPWTDKLCDYQSFNGINFKRFGIAATPVMFVVDKNGIVINQFSNLEETKLINTL